MESIARRSNDDLISPNLIHLLEEIGTKMRIYKNTYKEVSLYDSLFLH